MSDRNDQAKDKPQDDAASERAPYEKPAFVYEKKIEALAGSCGKTAADALNGDVDCQIQNNS